MSTTDTPKRLSDDEVVAQFLALEVFLGDVDGHDMTDWTTDEHGKMRGVDEGTIDASSAVEAMNAIRSHIAAITAPPSQGKVERAREISHNIVSYCRECSFNLDVLKYTREEAEEYVTSAITQALTESSGQGTDGAMPAWPDLEFDQRHNIATLMNQTGAARTRYENVRNYLRTNLKSKQPSDTEK